MRRKTEKTRAYKREWTRKWRAKNPERVKELNRIGRERHGERRKKAAREFRRLHPELARQQDRINYLKQRESNLRRQRTYRQKNKARVLKNRSEWGKNNRDKVRVILQRRRARKKGATVADCRAKIEILSKARFCHWCCVPLTQGTFKKFVGTDLTIDHIVPLSRGGLHAPDNLVAACNSCNTSKGNKLVSEWTWGMAA